MRLRLFTKGFLLLLVLTPAAMGFSNTPGLDATRTLWPTVVHVGEPVTATFTFISSSGEALRGFHFSDQIAEEVTDLATVSVTINDIPIDDFVFSAGVGGEILDGMIPHRWSLETPPDFVENHPVPEGACIVAVTYEFSFESVGMYAFPLYVWSGRTELSESPVFGYGEAADTVLVRPTSSVGDGEIHVGTGLELTLSPNPGTRLPTVHLASEREGLVRLDVYDAAGRRLGRVFKGMATAHGMTLPPSHALQELGRLPSGVYFWVLSREDVRRVRRFVLVGSLSGS
jgi:hypothetical protein